MDIVNVKNQCGLLTLRVSEDNQPECKLENLIRSIKKHWQIPSPQNLKL